MLSVALVALTLLESRWVWCGPEVSGALPPFGESFVLGQRIRQDLDEQECLSGKDGGLSGSRSEVPSDIGLLLASAKFGDGKSKSTRRRISLTPRAITELRLTVACSDAQPSQFNSTATLRVNIRLAFRFPGCAVAAKAATLGIIRA